MRVRNEQKTGLKLDGQNAIPENIFVNFDFEKRKRIYWENPESRSELGNAISILFTSAYRLDLMEDRYIALKQTTFETKRADEQGVGDSLKMIYVDCMPEKYREKFLKTFNVDNLRKELTWEKPEIAMEIPVEIDDSQRWYRFCAVLTVMGKEYANRCAYLIQDVTLDRQLEQQKQEALRMAFDTAKKASEAKTEFLSNMSHDIRTPMNAIIGMTKIARMYIDDKERVQDCLNKINISSQHLLAIINEVLDMSKIESGKMELRSEAFHIGEWFENMMTMIKPQVREKQQHLSVSICNLEHKNVMGDPHRLRQVVMNLLSNAVKYTPKGGSIEAKLMQLSQHGDERAVYRIMVKDNGIGISEEFQKIMFEPFTRDEDKAASEACGTGLGMSIANNIVSMMDGTIQVESSDGNGTTITVEVELELQPKHGAEWENDINSKDNAENNLRRRMSLSPKRILLVEDNAMNMEIASEIISDVGIIVDKASDGFEALKCVEKAAPGYYQLILMDIRMPRMDGYTVTKKIRQLDRTDAKTVPIIAMTANAFNDDKRMAEDAGMNGHIAKPVDMDKLYLMLQRWL
jgi:signal transduction histidine kinase/ActR/RegA family two-component response regulator